MSLLETSNWAAHMRARADAVAAELTGTCKSIHEVATDEEMDDSFFCARLDELVFECAECNWWQSVDELSLQDDCGEQFCDECRPGEDNEEEG